MLLRILISIMGDDIAPRFDLATEVQIITTSNGVIEESKTIVLPQPSAEKLCQLIITENVKSVICGGIEDEYHQYLTWKRIQIFDSVIGRWQSALNMLMKKTLSPGDIISSGEKQ